MSKQVLHTKFGTAHLHNGYYRISSRIEGNNNKLLHRLIFEDFYGFIPDGFHVHHKDGNPTNNCILNLKLMRSSTHISEHMMGNSNRLGIKHTPETKNKISNAVKGKNHPLYGKHHTEETKNLISKKNAGENSKLYGKPKPLEQKIKISQVNNTAGYFRVSKHKSNQYKQGFIWQYTYIDDNGKCKKISSVNLKKLEKKVVSKGLIWIKFNEE